MLVAAACGAEAVPSDGAERKTTATTAHVRTVTQFWPGEGGEPHEFRSTEIHDYAADRATSVDGDTGCRTITIGDAMYEELPPGYGLPAGKRWVKWEPEPEGTVIPEDREETTTNADGSVTITSWMTSVAVVVPRPGPGEYLDYLREHAERVDRVGEDAVQGVPTTRYRARLDLRPVTRMAMQEWGSEPAEIDRALESLYDPTEEIDIWVDAEGRARRVVTTTSSDDGAEGGSERTVTTTDYVDFGVRVVAEPPPEQEVIGSREWLQLTEERIRTERDEPAEGADDESESSAPSSCLD